MTDTFIISFPHSGSHWLRYIIEYLSDQSTCGKYIDRGIWKPIINNNDPICYFDHQMKSEDVDKYKLIYLVRDYKECFISLSKNAIEQISILELETLYKGYMIRWTSMFKLFKEWKPPKLLIRYEDLILKPEYIIKELCEFLNKGEDKIKKFLSNYDEHKDKSLNIRANKKTNWSEGSIDFDFHKKQVDINVLNILTNLT